MWSSGQGQNGQNEIGNVVICSLYINNIIYIIVDVLTVCFLDFDK